MSGAGPGGECRPRAPPHRPGCPDLCELVVEGSALPVGQDRGPCARRRMGSPLALGEQLCGLHASQPDLESYSASVWGSAAQGSLGQSGGDEMGQNGYFLPWVSGPRRPGWRESMATQGGGVGRSQAPDPPLRYLNQGPSQAGLTVHWWSDGTSGQGWEGQLGGSGEIGRAHV